MGRRMKMDEKEARMRETIRRLLKEDPQGALLLLASISAKMKEEKASSGKMCRWCGSRNIIKNGKTKDGRQRYRCKDCGRSMVENPKLREMTMDDILLAVELRGAGLSYREIGEALGYSEATIRDHVSVIMQLVTANGRS